MKFGLYREGFVYFAKPPRADVIKIGWSTVPLVRVRQLSYRGRYGRFVLLGYFAGDLHAEAAMHERFARVRLRLKEGSEFFRYSAIQDEVDSLLSRKAA